MLRSTSKMLFNYFPIFFFQKVICSFLLQLTILFFDILYRKKLDKCELKQNFIRAYIETKHMLPMSKNYHKSSILSKMESKLGVTEACLLSSPTTQQCFAAVLMATTSWENTRSRPGETYIHLIKEKRQKMYELQYSFYFVLS